MPESDHDEDKPLQEKGLSLAEYLSLQFTEIKSALNRWGAGLFFGHEPNDDECAQYYVECGASDRFRKAHPRCDI